MILGAECFDTNISSNIVMDSVPLFTPEKLESSQGPINFNASILLNQSGYLPNTDVNVTISLTNNQTQNLTDIWFNTTLNANLTITSGSLLENFSVLAVNETLTSSFIFRLPENNESLSLDVVFLLDGSGSMSEEINNVKNKING